MEQWRDVVGYEGLYQVSDLGQIRSVSRRVSTGRGRTRMSNGKVLRASPVGTTGYLAVGLSKGGKARTVAVHRIVLEAWVGPCPDGHEGCHNDDDQSNNAVCNLRWDTHRNNCNDRTLNSQPA